MLRCAQIPIKKYQIECGKKPVKHKINTPRHVFLSWPKLDRYRDKKIIPHGFNLQALKGLNPM